MVDNIHNYHQQSRQHMTMGSRLRRRQVLSVLSVFLCNVPMGTAFIDSHILRQLQPLRPTSPRLHTIPQSVSSSTKSQRSMIPQTVILDVLLKHATWNKKDDGPNMILKAAPFAFLTKALTTPTAAFGLTGTTMLTTTAAAAGSIFTAGSSSVSTAIASDVISVETQVLNDMSHLGIDLAVFFIPSLLALRIAAIIGRICTIIADYIPDHVIVPEELVFQSAMLCLACAGLIKSALIPAAASAYSATVSVKDGRAYRSIFQPAGTTWSQYKALSVCGALEWVTLQAGDTVSTTTPTNASGDTTVQQSESEEFMYWLYSGDVAVETNNGEHQYVVSTNGTKKSPSLPRGLIGEQQLLQLFSKNTKAQPGRSSSKHQRETSKSSSGGADHRVEVTSSTATLLRIDTHRLQMLMDLDPTLAESMRTMVFQGIEAKLQAQVKETTNLLKSFNVTSTSTVW